jgi:hypothetical protein
MAFHHDKILEVIEEMVKAWIRKKIFHMLLFERVENSFDNRVILVTLITRIRGGALHFHLLYFVLVATLY